MLLHCLCNLRRLSWAQSYTTKITLISSQKPEQIFWTSPTSVEIELCTIIHKLLWGQYQLTPKTIHKSIWISARKGPQKLLGLHALISVKATRREVLNHWACFIRVISTYTLEMNTDVLEERSLTFTAEIQVVRVHKYLHHLQINARQFSSFSGAAPGEKHTLSPAPAGGIVFLHISNLCPTVVLRGGVEQKANFLNEKRLQTLCTDLSCSKQSI